MAEPRRRTAPLAPVQARMWFLHQLRPRSAEYNLQLALRLRGDLHPAALANALALVVARHEPLRTRFVTDDRGVPGQDTLPTWQPTLDTRPPAGSGPIGADAIARAVVAEEVARPFDLSAAPPLRARLVRLGPADHLFALTMHHVLIDGWSIGLLADELAIAYRALVRDLPLRLPELGVSYRDWAVAESAARADDGAGLDFWRRQLAGLGELELPADRSGHGVGGALITCRRTVSPETAGGLAGLARECRTSLFTVAFAAYTLLLHRYGQHGAGGRSDFAVGMPVANRADPALERLIGCFLNTVCVRARIEERATVRELVADTATALRGALAHQHVPFEDVVRAVGADRGNDRNPLFTAFCSALDATAPRFDLDGLRSELVVPDYPLARFDLAATFALAAEPASLQLEFSAALFEPASAERLTDQLVRILDWVAIGADESVGGLPLLGAEQRFDLLDLINGGVR